MKPAFITPLPIITTRRNVAISSHPRTLRRRRVAIASAQNRDNDDKPDARGVDLFVSDLRQLGTRLKMRPPPDAKQTPEPLRSVLGNNILSLLAQSQGMIERGIERDIAARQQLLRNFYVPGSAVNRFIRLIAANDPNEWRPLQYFEWQRVAAELPPAAARSVQRTQREKMIESVKKTTANVIRASITMSGRAVLALMDATVTGMKRKSKRKRRKRRMMKTAQATVINTGVRSVRRQWNLSGYETRLFFVVAGAIGAKAVIVAAAPLAAVASTAYVVSEASAPRAVPMNSRLLDEVVKRRSSMLKRVDSFLANRRKVGKLLPPSRSNHVAFRSAESTRGNGTVVNTGVNETTTTGSVDVTEVEEERIDSTILETYDLEEMTESLYVVENKDSLKVKGGVIRNLMENGVERNGSVPIVDTSVKQVGSAAPAVLYTPIVGNVLQGVDAVAYFMETGAARAWRRIEMAFGMERRAGTEEWEVLSVFRWQRENERTS